MRFSRVLLVSPPSASYLGAARVPSGLGYIAQSLWENGIECDVLDLRFGKPVDDLERRIRSFLPDLVGFSLVTLEYKKSYRLISEVKERFPEIGIVGGGHHFWVMREKVLEECPAIDFGVVHEGEETIVELCQDQISLENIKGLIRRENGSVIYNGDRATGKNLDEISFPRYINFDLKKYTNERPIISSRGCVYQCIFCPNRLLTKKFRPRSAANVVDEIEYWFERGIRQFNIDDDNFTLSNKRVFKICDEIERRRLTGLFIRCSNGIRADRTTRHLLERMQEVGFHEVGFGVDGGNNRMLRILKKGETIETIKRAVENACDLGYDVKLFFLVGSPGETRSDVEDTIQLARSYPIERVNLNNPIPYPGTELYDWVAKHGYFIRKPEDYLNNTVENLDDPVFETPELPRQERIQILKECRKVEKEVTRKAVARTFSRFYPINWLLGYLFATDFFQRQYFYSVLFRKFVEAVRYRKKISRKYRPAGLKAQLY
ncbi:MAG: B12-binding domain-containing radical SAM protein [Candidatus Hodarchaeota archaeon]